MENRVSIRVNAVKAQLLNNHTIKVKSSWIEDCVKFFISQVVNIDDETLYQQAFEQFLLAELKDASNPVIPSLILEKKQPFTLSGTFVLQMNFLIDIGKSMITFQVIKIMFPISLFQPNHLMSNGEDCTI